MMMTMVVAVAGTVSLNRVRPGAPALSPRSLTVWGTMCVIVMPLAAGTRYTLFQMPLVNVADPPGPKVLVYGALHG